MSVVGVNMSTGRDLEGIDHLRQSVRDILTTPIGSRVMRRDYGSNLFDLIDANLTPLTIALIYASIADALRKWEPRLRVTRIQAEAVAADLEDGKVSISLEAVYLPDGRAISMDGLII